jgi:CRP/FNR family cyclic AMP-dependent transcriptional regulator
MEVIVGSSNPWYWSRVNLFDQVSSDGREMFLSRAERHEYRRGEHVFHATDAANRVFFLATGLVRIYHLSPGGALTIFWFCEPGDMFGAGGLAGTREQCVYGQAVERSVVFSMSRAVFEEILHAQPRIALNVIKLLSARLRLACDSMADRATQKVETRLARVLLRLAQNWGDISASGVRLRVKISHQELANMIGASRQTVNKSLREYTRAGWLVQEGRTLVLRDPAGLTELLGHMEALERGICDPKPASVAQA